MTPESPLNDAPCGYLILGAQGDIRWANNTIAHWLGYEQEQLINKGVEHLFNLPTKIFYNTHFFPVLKLHGKAEEIYMTLTARDRTDLPVLVNANTRTVDSQPEYHCVLITVLQRKKYEDEILLQKREAEKALRENKTLQKLTETLEEKTLELDTQYQKLVSINANMIQFSKIVSHDLNEPIRKIRLLSDVIVAAESERLTARGKSSLQKIDASAKRLKALVDGLQQYIIADSEKDRATVDLNLTVQKAIEKAQANRKFTDFDIISSDLPSIQAYPNQLENLFYQLIDNAIQFRRPEQRLEVRIKGILLEENQYRVDTNNYKFVPHLRVTIADNGIGLDNQYKNYVFQLLKRVNQHTEGLGIGLSLVKKIVANHSGSIDLSSEEGQGTQIAITLPMQ